MPGGDELCERPEDLRGGHSRIRHVDLIQVDAIGPQLRQALVDMRADAIGGLLVAEAHQVELRREHHLVAPILQRCRDVALGLALPVHDRGVDEVDAEVERGVDDFDRGCLVDAGRAERVAPQSDDRDRDAGRAERLAASRHPAALGIGRELLVVRARDAWGDRSGTRRSP